MPKETFECNSDERDLKGKFDAKLVDYVKHTTEIRTIKQVTL